MYKAKLQWKQFYPSDRKLEHHFVFAQIPLYELSKEREYYRNNSFVFIMKTIQKAVTAQ